VGLTELKAVRASKGDYEKKSSRLSSISYTEIVVFAGWIILIVPASCNTLH